MPRLRPLELVSRSLGREWSLLPPNVSFRTELKALYAAMLRTFYLSSDAIRALCRWDPQSLRQQPDIKAGPGPAGKPSPIPLDMRHPTHAQVRRSRQSNTLAAGACVIGGVAAIAWLMANHPRQPAPPTLAAAPDVTLNAATNHDGNVHSRSGNIGHQADAPVAWNRARGDLMARKPGASATISTSGSDAGRASSPPAVLTTTAAKKASASPAAGHDTPATQASRTNAERAMPIAPRAVDAASVPPKSAKPSRADHAARDIRKANSTKRERNEFPGTSERRVPHAVTRARDIAPPHGLHATSDGHASSEARLSTGHRARHLPSVAGDYSPLAPSARLNGDYDSVTMSAGTHIREVAPVMVRQDRASTNSTEWMNHLSQRRVTEVPDSFSK
ncbi:hypothetical protein K788_0003354 [Paraburkholderia caribensis MBA4]|uniref:Uncharacterized protein n=1 Tax=Paraburkholderia caribensis MBA4 TaxID=1323664 RepID=A0A0P0RCK5_9BURK|nr:hypothetical protein [Paraburkholderia caribensis]ALL66062.1 hypothetical protein K788_0003354 [Paraburkholderia caribensis MBA4]